MGQMQPQLPLQASRALQARSDPPGWEIDRAWSRLSLWSASWDLPQMGGKSWTSGELPSAQVRALPTSGSLPRSTYVPWCRRRCSEKSSAAQGLETAFVKYKKKSHSRSKTQVRWSENWILPWGEELPGSSQRPQDKAGFNLSRYRNNVQYA